MTLLRRALSLLLSVPVLLAFATARADEPPAALESLKTRGLTIEKEFSAPAGLRGFVGRVNGQPVVIYAAPGGEEVIVGHMIDADGNSLSEQHIAAHLPPPDLAAAWTQLEQADWLREGAAGAERVVYVFTDPNCPYCSAFWRAARPYVGDQAQLRHILVGVIRPDSINKSAAIMAADDPAAALARHEESHAAGTGGIEPLDPLPAELQARVEANNAVMSAVGAHATPAIFFEDENGQVHQLMGMQPLDVIAEQIFQQPEQPPGDPGLERYRRN